MIRTLTPADTRAYTRLRKESFVKAPLSFDHEPDTPVQETDVRESLCKTSDEFFVLGYFLEIEGREKLVGTWGFKRFERKKRAHRGMIFGVYISELARGRGIGHKLMAETIRRARKLEGLERIILSVSHHAVGARKIYERAGFVEFGREPGAARTGDVPMDEIHLMLNL